MSDVGMRELERQWKSGDGSVVCRYLRALDRVQGFYPPALARYDVAKHVFFAALNPNRPLVRIPAIGTAGGRSRREPLYDTEQFPADTGPVLPAQVLAFVPFSARGK